MKAFEVTGRHGTGREGGEGGGGGGGGLDCLKSVSLSRFLQWKHAAKSWDEDDCDR